MKLICVMQRQDLVMILCNRRDRSTFLLSRLLPLCGGCLDHRAHFFHRAHIRKDSIKNILDINPIVLINH